MGAHPGPDGRPSVNRGLLYMVEATFWFSGMAVLVKFAGRTVPFSQIVLARCLIGLIACVIPLSRRNVPLLGRNRRWLFVRGAAGATALFGFFYSVTHLPLPDASVIQFTNPMWVVLMAAPLLGERIGRPEVIGGLLCLVGIGLIVQPAAIFGAGGAQLPTLGVVVAVLASVLTAVAYVAVRKLRETEEPLVIVLYLPLVAVVPAAIWAVSTGYLPTWPELALLSAIGAVTQIAQIRLTKGLMLTPAGPATAMTYLQVVFAFIWGATLFDETPSVLGALGSAVVIATTLTLALRRSRSKQASEPA